MDNKTSNILWGFVFICLGVLFALYQLNIITVYIAGWWTLFIIVPCLISMVNHGLRAGNLIGLIIGIMLFLSSQDLVSWQLFAKLIFPIILVIIGLGFIFRQGYSQTKKEISKLNKDGLIDYSAVFGSQQVKVGKEVFKGASLNAVFGGIDINLSDAIIESDIILEASAIFGGINIIVPSDVKVKVSSTPIFGGVSNKLHKNDEKNSSDSKEQEHTLYINALCMFGGVEIK